MKKLFRTFAAALAVSLAWTVATVDAADNRKKKKKEPESHPTVIASVSPTAIVIRENKADRTVPITPTTEIYVRGQKTNLGALQAGMAISITLAMDGDTASRVNASDPPPERDDNDKGKPKDKDAKRKKAD